MTITKCGFKRAAIALMAPVIIEIFVMGFNKEVAAKVGLLLVNENGGAKIFITGILLDYVWINYFITDKENNLKNKDKCLK